MSMGRLAICILMVILATLPLTSASALPKEGSKAPIFKVPVYGDHSVSPESLKGKVVVLMFAAPWCPHCRQEVPSISKAWKEAGLGDAEDLMGLLMVVSSNEREALNFFKAADPPPNWRLVANANKVAERYGVKGVPTTIVLDKNWTVVRIYVGAVPPERVISVVSDALGLATQTGNYTQHTVISSTREPTSTTQISETDRGTGLSLGAMILIALAIVLVGFGVWYYRTLKRFESSKSKKKGKKRKKRR